MAAAQGVAQESYRVPGVHIECWVWVWGQGLQRVGGGMHDQTGVMQDDAHHDVVMASGGGCG